MRFGLSLEHPVQLEGGRGRIFSKRLRPVDTGREAVVTCSVEGRLLKPKEMTFKKAKGINSVQYGREGRHMWSIHSFYFLFFTINYH